ncbi:hypothetical protein D9611_006922 [Ephemerocybe angulata]|uniref:Uncharacterized protein n=1 Tax=Ephemerocybe angulata TaxID=980116 RepID=A0A8H5EW27_9AGAR|nr:hypothetical protein D9611_006922 [Tulosesus angulatus]
MESISDQQRAVASQLTKAYRRILRNRELERAKILTQKVYDCCFVNCLKALKNMEWSHRLFYRKLYLGLVPHLLGCVDRVISYAHSAKARAKKRLRAAKVDDLEGLNKECAELGFLFRSSKRLHKALDPSSELHKQQDIEQLKILVVETEVLVKRVPPGSGLDVQFNLDIAIKGIVTEKKASKPESKPELLVDNANCLDDWVDVDDVDDVEDYVVVE